MHSLRWRPLCVLVAAAALAAACSGKKQATSTSPSATASATSTATTSPEASATQESPTASTSPTGSLPAPPALAWRACPPGAFQCATISVPLDWSNPTRGQKVSLALIRLPSSGARSEHIDSLFVNPGGPGASAVDFARHLDSVFASMPSVLRRFDIVAFDPRGMGGSEPLLCEKGSAMDSYIALNPPRSPADI